MRSSTTWPPTPSPTSDRLTVGGQFEHLWAGWRAAYIESVASGEPRLEPPGEGSLFERLLRLSDDEAFVVHRGTRCSALLNAYPYTNGHLLVLPNRAVAELSELDADEMVELWSMVRDGVAALGAAYGCDGVNVGMNLGAAAGAGVPEHLHAHVLPRWHGDTSFTTTVATTRVLPEPLDVSWQKLRTAWPTT
jgi:ATP adenylyltransferase